VELEKITKSRANEEKRRFDDACGLAHAMELLGERWAMLVLRELAYGPRRFSELKTDLAGISANVLAQRLTELEGRGLIRKTRLAPPASIQVYEATEWGLEVVPLIASLGRWAARSPWHNPTLRMSHVSVIMSFQTLLSPELAEGLHARVAFTSATPIMSSRSATDVSMWSAGRSRIATSSSAALQARSPRWSMAALPLK
jgi:DNA-binding HxlR family transcriptional regulator